MAFFDGSGAVFQGAMHVGDRLAEWTLTDIAHDHVRLKSGGREIELPISKQLRREASGEWVTTDQPRRAPSDTAPQPARASLTPPGPVVVKPPAPEMAAVPELPELSDKQMHKLEKKLMEPLKAEKLEKLEKDDLKLEFGGDKGIKRAVKEMR